MKPLSNQFVLVTGASGGIGGAIAVAMAEQGARVCISGRDERKLSELAERLRSICTQIDCVSLRSDQRRRGRQSGSSDRSEFR